MPFVGMPKRGYNPKSVNGINGGIIATAGGGQANAFQLIETFNMIATVATASDSVKLKARPQAGEWQIVHNTTSNTLACFPQSGGNISGNGVNSVWNIMAGECHLLYCYDGFNWRVFMGLDDRSGSGFGSIKRALSFVGNMTIQGGLTFSSSGGAVTLHTSTGANIWTMADNLADGLSIKEGSNSYLKFVTSDNLEKIQLGKQLTVANSLTITAKAGGGQDTTFLTADVNVVTVTGTAHDSVTLPVPVPGMHIYVANQADKALDIFPSLGTAIDSLGANAAYPATTGLIANTSTHLIAVSTTKWVSQGIAVN